MHILHAKTKCREGQWGTRGLLRAVSQNGGPARDHLFPGINGIGSHTFTISFGMQPGIHSPAPPPWTRPGRSAPGCFMPIRRFGNTGSPGTSSAGSGRPRQRAARRSMLSSGLSPTARQPRETARSASPATMSLLAGRPATGPRFHDPVKIRGVIGTKSYVPISTEREAGRFQLVRYCTPNPPRG